MSNPFAHDVFAPLSDKEKANAGRRAHESESDAGELVAPIPSDAPEPPESHPRFGKPSLRWTYPDARGSALFHVLRFDPPGERKQFMPLTLWRAADGLRWRWRSVRAPRPLYGLDRLAARPEASDDVGMRPVNNRAGWRKGNGSDREWLVPPEVWKAEICNGLDAKMVARVLAERGMLARSSDGFQQVRKIGGQARRVFVVTAGIYDGGGNDA